MKCVNACPKRAIQTAHAFAILDQIGAGENEIVIVNLSGRGDKDLSTFIKYLEHPNGEHKSDHE